MHSDQDARFAAARVAELGLTPKQMARLLKKAIPARRRIMIKGAPGIGKTDIVNAVARGLGGYVILRHPAIEEPIDQRGALFRVNDTAEFIPIGEMRFLFDPQAAVEAGLIEDIDQLLIVFFDDIGQAPPAVQKALMPLLLAGQIQGRRVAPNVRFIGATNRKVDRAGVSGMLEPVKSRFCAIVELIVSAEEWIQWACENGVHEAVTSWIRYDNAKLFVHTPTADLENGLCPRTVTSLAKWVDMDLDPELRLPTYAGAVGAAGADAFLAFNAIREALPDVRTILADPSGANMPTDNPGAMWALSGTLARIANEERLPAILTYMSRSPEREYSIACVDDAAARHPELTSCGLYNDWVRENQNVTH